jgi:FtsP/CotA-like multicopper oxidase with cupredoxin domain
MLRMLSWRTCDHARVIRRLAPKVATFVGVALLVAVLAVLAKTWYDSRLPGTYSVMAYGEADYGGGSVPVDHSGHAAGTVSDSELHGPAGRPDVHFDLTAKAATVHLDSGRAVEALTFNGTSPGPELRVKQGELVEVTLRNADVDQGVTIHWHGVDVPNAEDGVAGVTQNAVLPGESYTYRFRAKQLGTFWYHTHQVSSEDVQRGLFGAFVIESRVRPANAPDRVLIAHTFDGIATLNGHDTQQSEQVPPGTPVRLRLVNSDSAVRRFSVSGTAFRVVAIDGHDLNGPAPLEHQSLPLAAGGRYDIEFAMPEQAVLVKLESTNTAVVLTPPGASPPPTPDHAQEPDFDPLTYGRPAPTPFSASSTFDRDFSLRITKKLGFFDGRPGRQWALNGGIYPDVPMFVVTKNDLVRVTIANDTSVVHPMHLHGHHALVLRRNGVKATGSPWWVDTLNVDPGDEYVIAFRADNPGIWMDHCHNLGHAAAGLTMHVAYEGITTPFVVGGTSGNEPE